MKEDQRRQKRSAVDAYRRHAHFRSYSMEAREAITGLPVTDGWFTGRETQVALGEPSL